LLAEKFQDSCGKIYHIVDPDQQTVREYIQTYCQITGKRLRVLYFPTFLWTACFGLLDKLLWLLQGKSSNLCYRLRSIAHGAQFDTTAAQEELGWKTRVSFEEGMKRTFGG